MLEDVPFCLNACGKLDKTILKTLIKCCLQHLYSDYVLSSILKRLSYLDSCVDRYPAVFVCNCVIVSRLRATPSFLKGGESTLPRPT